MKKIISPLFVYLPRKTISDKKFILNLNNYRNTHYQSLNQAKVVYKEFIATQVLLLPEMMLISTHMTLYPKTQRRTDVPNVISIHEKFFMDALVELGKLPDDDYYHHITGSWSFGGVDKDNPRVEIEIREVQRKQYFFRYLLRELLLLLVFLLFTFVIFPQKMARFGILANLRGQHMIYLKHFITNSLFLAMMIEKQ